MQGACLLALALALALSPAPEPHPDSLSSSRLVVAGAEVAWTIRVQPTSVREVLPDADGDDDGWLGAAEVERAAPEIGAYLAERFRLRPEEGAPPLALGVARCELLSPDVAGLASTGEPWIEVALEGRADAPLEGAVIEVDAFHETSPAHRDVCEVLWNVGTAGEQRGRVILDARFPALVFDPAAPPPDGLGGWLRLGVEHILTGWDHLAFLLALLVASRGVRSLVAVVTAFTLAHSLTLALAALEVVTPSARFVELAIALSIAFVGVQSLLSPRPHGLWPEAFVFGLIHGLGFAGFLRDSLSATDARLAPLVGFNVGVELGQLAIVLAAVALLRLLARVARRPSEAERLVPRPVAVPISLVVTALGLLWFAQRAAWIG